MQVKFSQSHSRQNFHHNSGHGLDRHRTHQDDHFQSPQEQFDFEGTSNDLESTSHPACASFMNAKNKARQHASAAFKNKCNSLQTKMNLHKGRVRHSRLIVLAWIQCGALDQVKKTSGKNFKLIPKELGSSDCE